MQRSVQTVEEKGAVIVAWETAPKARYEMILKVRSSLPKFWQEASWQTRTVGEIIPPQVALSYSNTIGEETTSTTGATSPTGEGGAGTSGLQSA